MEGVVTIPSMGHLGKLKEQYRELVGRLDVGTVALPEPSDPAAWQGWKEILEILYTPEEAALAARLPWRPTSLEKLARLLDVPAAELAPRLDAMCEKGVVMDLVHPRTGKASYLLSPPVVGFFEYSLMRAKDSIPKKRMAEALRAYTHGDEAFAREALGRDTVIGRALVHETALSDDPLPDVLDWERATHVVGEARAWAVSLCYCRHKQEHLGQACDAPVDVCLTLNGGADFVTRRGFGRAVERSEALDILAASREKGLVQIADNVQDRPTFVCNCCGCCCEQLQAANRWGLKAVNGSGFAPRADVERCSGCSRCARACPVAAVEMVPSRREADRKNAHGAPVRRRGLHRVRRLRHRLPQGRPAHGAGRDASDPSPATRWRRRSARRSSGTGSPSCSSTAARGWETASCVRRPGPSPPCLRPSSCSRPSRSAPGS